MDVTPYVVAAIGTTGTITAGVLALIGNLHRQVSQINRAVNHVGPDGLPLTNRLDLAASESRAASERTFRVLGSIEAITNRTAEDLAAHSLQDRAMFDEIHRVLTQTHQTLGELVGLEEIVKRSISGE